MGRPINPNSEHWKKMRAKIIKRDKCCFVCSTKNNLTVHHIKPRRKGGKTHERNLIAMCAECHDRVEYYDMDWPAIINFQKQKRYGFSDDFDAVHGEPRKVGRDKFGIFVVRGIPQNASVTYDGVWPIATPKIKESPVYFLLPVTWNR